MEICTVVYILFVCSIHNFYETAEDDVEVFNMMAFEKDCVAYDEGNLFINHLLERMKTS